MDLVKSKLYINGQKMSTKDFHSQTIVVEVFSYLLQHINQPVSNKNLPISTYSKELKEMHGKVITPLKRAIQKYLGKELELTVKGHGANFTLRLSRPTFSIGILTTIK